MSPVSTDCRWTVTVVVSPPRANAIDTDEPAAPCSWPVTVATDSLATG